MTKLIEQTYSRSTQILSKLNRDSGTDILTVYEPGYVSPHDLVGSTRFYGYITDIRCRVYMDALPEVELPEIQIGDSRTKRITAVRDMEWTSPRKQMNLLLRDSKSGGWVNIASISLLKRPPYYQVNLMQFLSDNVAFAMANDSALGVQIENVGYGLLIANDEVTIWGSVKEELSVLPQNEKIVTHTQSHAWNITEDSSVLLASNTDRLLATFVNIGGSNAYLNFNTDAISGRGITLMPGGGSYEINITNPFKGSISAITAQGETTTVTGIEGS